MSNVIPRRPGMTFEQRERAICGCHGNKTEKKLKTLKIFLSETIRVRATKFGM